LRIEAFCHQKFNVRVEVFRTTTLVGKIGGEFYFRKTNKLSKRIWRNPDNPV
jgi:hypothetical protein